LYRYAAAAKAAATLALFPERMGDKYVNVVGRYKLTHSFKVPGFK
jgi:hypothetical protein